MSVARNSMSRFPYYSYKEIHGFGNNFGGFRLLGAAASPSVAIVVGTNSAPSVSLMTASGSVIKTSTDGIIWSDVSSTSFGTNSVTQIAYGNDTFVAMGASNTIATSPGTSGTTWTQRTSPASGTGPWNYLTFQNGIFVAVYTSSVAYTSTDGITWSAGATISNNGLTTWQAQQPKGGIFYIANNPSSAKWLQVYGQAFATTSQTHFAVYQDITSSGTISSTYATDNSGSYGPQWIPDDNKLLVSVASMTSAGFSGHASALTSHRPTSPTSRLQIPATDVPSGVFFPSVLPRVGTIQIGASTASSVLAQFAGLARVATQWSAGGASYKKALYVYNDGYYNCLYIGDEAFQTGGTTSTLYAYPTVNVAFRADNPSFAESVQLIGTSGVPQAGVSVLGSNLGARHGGFERAIHINFKGNSYIFFIWWDNSNHWTHGYMQGTRSIKPLRTTIGLGI